MDFDSKTNQELLRYLIVLLLAPVWVPFGKALFRELRRALRPDGGLYGEATSPRQRAEIEKLQAREEDPLVHEPIANARRGRASPNRPRTGPQRPQTGPPAKPTARRQGFR